MKEPLFKVPNNISEQQVVERMQYYKDQAYEIQQEFEKDKSLGRSLAIELRKEIDMEYKNIDRVKTEDFYNQQFHFRVYRAAIQDVSAGTSGQLDKGEKTEYFLFNVTSYMNHYLHDFDN